MTSGQWTSPVIIYAGKHDVRRFEVSDAAKAIEFLDENWPPQFFGSQKHYAARNACHQVLTGSVNSEVARKAFVEAAKEAHILGG